METTNQSPKRQRSASERTSIRHARAYTVWTIFPRPSPKITKPSRLMTVAAAALLVSLPNAEETSRAAGAWMCRR